MKIEDFWNQAFISALARLPAAKAKAEADKATKICIDHWHDNCVNWSPANMPRVQDIDIANVRMPGDGKGGFDRSAFGLHTETPRGLGLAMAKKPRLTKRSERKTAN